MRVLIKKDNEYARIYPVLSLVTGAIFLVVLTSSGSVSHILCFGLVLVCFLISLKRFSYTYWSLLTLHSLMIFLITYYSDVEVPVSKKLILFTSYLFLYALSVYLFNPIIFPAVSWFEYDFRYRHDLECYYCSEMGCYQSRLVDLKSNSGSLHSFQNIELGDQISLFFRFKENSIKLTGEVQSIRQNSLGGAFITVLTLVILKASEC